MSIASAREGYTPGRARLFAAAQDAALVCISAVFFYAHVRHMFETHNISSVFFGAEQGLLLAMFLTRRRSMATSQRPADWLVAAAGGWLSLAMRPDASGGWLEGGGTVVQLVGLTLVTACFLALGKSFGVVAADRGLKVHGPYQLVRHPIYFAHTVTLAGFTLANLNPYNVAIFTTVSVCQVLRIRAEERLLMETSDYAVYRQRVRFRLIPGVY